VDFYLLAIVKQCTKMVKGKKKEIKKGYRMGRKTSVSVDMVEMIVILLAKRWRIT
jgi:hypothetical protein